MRHHRLAFCLAASLVVLPVNLQADDTDSWTNQQRWTFLKKAKIVDSKPIGKGVTHPWRLTLSDGTVRHDAAFQSVEMKKTHANLGDRTEINFQDSYRFNVAAYELAVLLGFPDMIPVTVERRWRGKPGALTWWVNARGDENERVEKKENPPDVSAWSDEMHRVRVFTALVEDTDRHGGNLLIMPDWKIVMIDFTRAFRRNEKLIREESLRRCDRNFLDALQSLDHDALEETLKPYLAPAQRKAIWKRRSLLIEHFRKLVHQNGEEVVLY